MSKYPSTVLRTETGIDTSGKSFIAQKCKSYFGFWHLRIKRTLTGRAIQEPIMREDQIDFYLDNLKAKP